MRTMTLSAGDLATRNVVTIGADASLIECAQVMRARHVGSVIVTAPDSAGLVPIEVVTDRDIVVEAVAAGLDAATLTAADIMTAEMVSVDVGDDLLDILARMREHGVRRVLVLDDAGALAGIVALENLLEALGEQLDCVVRVVKAERARETTLRG